MENKAMNEELKSAEANTLLDAKNKVAQRHDYADWHQIDMTEHDSCEKAETKALFLDQVAKEYASQFQKQLKEKEEEIEKLNREWIGQNKRFVEQRDELLKQLTKSNEMAERLAEALRKLSSQEHIEQELYYRMINDAFDILEQYQNSKK